MRKIAAIISCLALLGACAEHDPILPGERTPIFTGNDFKMLDSNVPNLPNEIAKITPADCPYTQDSENVIWDGDRKIFSGFPTKNSVASKQTPVCSGNYVYAGLTTGELVKVNPKNRKIIWIADIFRASNMTGGASILDIIAPIVVRGNAVYAGGLGDAFCRIDATSGAIKWCDWIGTAVPFIVSENIAFVVGTDDYMYAIRTSDGAVYWRTAIETQSAPIYADKIITVGRQQINAETGEIITK